MFKTEASTSLEHLCYLNVLPNEIIRSIFFNQVNNSVITVGVSSVNNFGTLRCRSTTLAHIKESKPELGTALLTSESLKWPGFVEFDDVNKKILTFSSVGG